MPDFSKCVKANNGDIYCWDKSQNLFVRIMYATVPTQTVPSEVIENFMKKINGESGGGTDGEENR